MPKGQTVFIEWEGRRRSRREVIGELYVDGQPVGDIARRLGIRYQIVYQVVHPQAGSLARSPRSPAREPTLLDREGVSDAILVGCVSQKADRPLPARDLYVSELFRRRRAYADASGVPWWILSAEYGLVSQETVIAPYDTKIARRSLVDRHAIAAGVARGLEQALGSLVGKRIEIHAGQEYVETVGPTLRSAGASIIRPLEGLSFGYQLQWYGNQLGWSPASTNTTSAARSRRVREPSVPTVEIGDGQGLGRRLTERFMTGALDLSLRPGAPTAGWEGMPEVVAVKALVALGADGKQVRRFLTFNAAMDRARDADRLAQAAVRLYRDQPWTYDPERVVLRPVRELADALPYPASVSAIP